jgi:hypothetical protein
VGQFVGERLPLFSMAVLSIVGQFIVGEREHLVGQLVIGER